MNGHGNVSMLHLSCPFVNVLVFIILQLIHRYADISVTFTQEYSR
jgi:hypothetical protein